MTPVVSVIISNYNNRDYIQDAVNSALSQSLREIEVVVVDDCSTDDSYEIVTKMAQKDSRLRVFQTSANQGPSATRNQCITEARGTWIAVLDGDDVYHRDRLSKLIASAERDNADIVADDLVIFGDDVLAWKQIISSPGRIGVDEPFWVDPIEYPESNSFYTKAKPLGYLKPIIKAELLRDTQYNVSMHLAEDYDLVMRLLVRGAKMRVYPEVMYYYRRHTASLSHRLSRPKLEPVVRASESFFRHDARAMASPKLLPKWAELRSALIKRHVSLQRAMVFEDFVSGLRDRNPIKVLSICMKQPWVIGRIYVPLFARVMPILQRLSRWCVSRGLVFSGPESCLRK